MTGVSRVNRALTAITLASIYAVILYILVWGIDRSSGGQRELLLVVGLVLFPMAVASLVTIVAEPTGEGGLGRPLLRTAVTITGIILISIILFQEGGICVVMAAPFLYAGGALGTVATVWLLRKFRRRSARLLIVLPFIGLPIEPHIVYPDRYSEVRTVIEIAAPPAIVWRQTVEIPNIQPDELSWTFSHGIVGVPRPEDPRIDGEGVGAVRHLRWGQGIHFEEIVTAWEEKRFLAWNFHFGPGSIPPKVEAHIDVDSRYLHLQSGDYRLDEVPSGRTRLTLTTRYRIATPINAYCDWWGRIFLGDFHGIVVDVIRQRSEKEAAAISRTPSRFD